MRGCAAVYVRDCAAKGFAPIVDEETRVPGPAGHHYTVEYLCPSGELPVHVHANANVNVNVNELRLGLSNTTRNPEGVLNHSNRKS